MKDNLVEKIMGMVEEKLSGQEIEELINFLRKSMVTGLEDDLFFRNLAYEMTGKMKELALLIIDFRISNIKARTS